MALAWELSGFAAEDPKPVDSRSQEALLEHAQALMRHNQFFEAAMDVSKALESSPDWVPGLKLYAVLLAYHMDNQDRAVEVLQKCLKLAPSDFEVWLDLGDIYLSQRRNAEAVRDMETAVRLAPRSGLALGALALAYDKSGDSAKAAALFPRAVELNRSASTPDSHPPILYGEYLLNQNDPAGSIPLFTEALRVDPTIEQSLLWKSQGARATGTLAGRHSRCAGCSPV